MKKIIPRLFNIGTFLFVFLILELVLLSVVLAVPTINLQSTSNAFASEDSNIAELKTWVESFNYYAKLNNLSLGNNTESKPETTLINTLTSYQDYRDNHYKFPLLSLPEINFEVSEDITIDLEPPVKIIENDKFPQGERYEAQKGESTKYTYKALTVSSKKYIVPVSEPFFEKENIIVTGSANRATLQSDLQNELKEMNSSDFKGVYYKKLESEEITVLDKLDVGDIFFNVSQESEVVAGKVEMINKSCSERVDLKLSFDPETQLYYFPELKSLELKDCTIYTPVASTPIVYAPEETVICQDCKYAPIDKTTALSSTYIPSLVATDLPGGGMLTPETVAALKRMSDDVYSNGMTIYITSAYRSYIQQQSTFNYWVNRELAKGASAEVARQRANIYSAIPGHSEHQLGTTLDVKCIGCDAFSKDVANTPLYQYLQQHAHEYGFVISYPQGKQHLTGYTYEPWHIRYIGVELASELQARGYQSSGNNQYLSAFLREKGLY